jgi:hypothetical protein
MLLCPTAMFATIRSCGPAAKHPALWAREHGKSRPRPSRLPATLRGIAGSREKGDGNIFIRKGLVQQGNGALRRAAVTKIWAWGDSGLGVD